MAPPNRNFPEVDDLAYATVKRITNYAVYLELEEYGRRNERSFESA